MDLECYRLLVFRYILLIAFGCWLATAKHPILSRKVSVLLCGIGIIFILMTQYLGYRPRILCQWTSTCIIAVLYVLPLTVILVTKCTTRCPFLELCGKASYHIFLAQMVYYCGAKLVYTVISNRTIQFSVGFAASVTAGILFYFFETALTKRLRTVGSKLWHAG